MTRGLNKNEAKKLLIDGYLMEVVDKIKRRDESNNGAVDNPDKIISFKSL